MFEAVAKTCSNVFLYEVGAAAVLSGGTRMFFHLLQGLSLPLLSVLRLLNTQDKLQVLWWRLGHSSAKAAF